MKKRIISYIAISILALSCTKAQAPEDTTITLFLGTPVASGQLGTKAINDLLSETMPTGAITINLQSTTNPDRYYQVHPGESLDLALDTYQVRGTYNPATTFNCLRGTFSIEPRYSVETTINVDGTQSAYQIPVTWECFAVVKDATKIAAYRATNASTNTEEVTTWAGTGDIKLIYVYCNSAWDSKMALKLTADPVDGTNYQTTTWRLVTTPVAGSFLVSNGNWYEFTPDGVATSNGSLSLSFPEWNQGIE